MLKIGVMGAGAIGSYVGGLLAGSSGGADVVDLVFVGRRRWLDEVRGAGLHLSDDLGRAPVRVDLAAAELQLSEDPGALADRDVVLVCVKSGGTAAAGAALAAVLPAGALVVSLQNGLHNAEILRRHLPAQRVLGGIVGFNVVAPGAGTYRRATTGPLAIEDNPDPRLAALGRALTAAGFEVELAADIRAVQWSKLVMNLNNAVSALTDVPTGRLIFEAPYRRIVAAVMGEAVGVLRRAGVRTARLGPLPVGLFPLVLRLPTPVLRAVARVQIAIDPEARSSMWEDLSRRRPTEVEELNGEIVRLAEAHGAAAPLNRRMVQLVHAAERRGAGPPGLGAEALWRALHDEGG